MQFTEKLKEFLILLENWLEIPNDLAQLDLWLDSAEELAYSYEFTDIEQSYIDKIIDFYEEEFRLLISTHTIQSPTQEYMDGLLTRKQIEQRTPEWYAQMATILSASELGNLFASPRTRAKLVMTKTQPYTPRNNPLAVPSNMMSAFDWGIRFEPVVKQIYEHKYGAEVKELGRLHHQIDPRCTASPDGLIYSSSDMKRKGRLIEIKCPVTREIDGTVPKDYYAQMQMQLQVTGLYACEYVEAQFSSQYNYNPVKFGPGLYNGTIALIRYADPTFEKEYYYQYSPVNDVEWVPSLEEGEEVVELIPWSLLQWSEQLVVKSEDWWKNIQPAIENFWTDVEKAKRGEFVVPELSRPRKQKEEKCVIIFNKMDES
jgi:putative phage-type endonuclease